MTIAMKYFIGKTLAKNPTSDNILLFFDEIDQCIQ
ncbi:Uncharacterised protein [Klebsiella pneumoniae]|uniref:Uncharacterized protein n=1 Tax=Klebsiella pneumoniae subsp. ozaenae TaxID=574 RepID=A0A377ZNQ5_KLEPO|nr:Uncharacterised protein [Klebsiella pneumoniae subsp. ozaenae]SXC09410.1 Uncharacterised protein [Klebsiella pneumoniae]SYI70050.1 Uncharacterised protein [Klebsiella pneumoniae]SYS40627.1 Uncharacterised protein [Klebsiella pneumoniae]VCZ40932.1 hypothetical protein BANRA_02311 [Klebsiella pneumoniae]